MKELLGIVGIVAVVAIYFVTCFTMLQYFVSKWESEEKQKRD